jgi:hypothetical protein
MLDFWLALGRCGLLYSWVIFILQVASPLVDALTSYRSAFTGIVSELLSELPTGHATDFFHTVEDEFVSTRMS